MENKYNQQNIIGIQFRHKDGEEPTYTVGDSHVSGNCQVSWEYRDRKDSVSYTLAAVAAYLNDGTWQEIVKP